MEPTLDIDRVRALIDLVAEERIAELLVQDSDGCLRIERVPAPGEPTPLNAPPTAAPPRPQAEVVAPAVAPPPPGLTVTAPMVGTFYRAAQAGGAPLVSVGDVVEVGTPLAVIEAMKMLNELASEHAGTVTQVLGENGRMVEVGQPLFVIA